MADLIARLRDAQAEGVGSAKLFNLIDEAAAALEAAREDAERWRFVREQSPATIRLDGNMRGSGFPDGLVPSYYRANTAAELDDAIDQARGKAGQEVES
jgi:hypothetical protein